MNLIKKKWFVISLIVLSGLFIFFKGKNLYSRYFNSYVTDPDGMVYKFLEGKKSTMPLDESYHLLVRYMLIGSKGDTIINSFKADTATEIPYPMYNSNIIMAALRKMTENSRMDVLVKTDSIKQQFGYNKGLKNYEQIMAMPNNEYAHFIIEVGKVLNEHDYEVYVNRKSIYRVETEANAIDAYCDSLKQVFVLNPEKHFRYCIEKSTKLTKPVIGDAISYNVVVTKFNTVTHMSTILEGKKYKTILGKPNHMLMALNMLPLYMNYGETVTFVVPSYHCYDASGSFGVAPYEPLIIKIFDLEKE